jgi:hypothetical protein
MRSPVSERQYAMSDERDQGAALSPRLRRALAGRGFLNSYKFPPAFRRFGVRLLRRTCRDADAAESPEIDPERKFEIGWAERRFWT